MKARKNRMLKEAAGDAKFFIKSHSMKQMGRHKELDRKFARQLADAIEQFADKKGMTPDEIFDGGDDLMSEFANWSKKKLGLDIDQNMPSAEEFLEGSGSGMDEFAILDWIYEDMGDCEWAEDLSFLDNENAFEVTMPGPDGDVFKVSVTKVWSGKPGKRLD